MDHATLIETARRRSARRRSAAWASVPEDVLGLPLSPITPATFDLLHGTGNAFVSGHPPTLADVRNFILYHSPDFDPDHPTARFWPRFRISLRISAALCPPLTPRARRAAITAANLTRAITEIRAIVTATWADALPGNDDETAGPSLAACLHAQLVLHGAQNLHTLDAVDPKLLLQAHVLFDQVGLVAGLVGQHSEYHSPGGSRGWARRPRSSR